MILTKSFLNEQVQKRAVFESLNESLVTTKEKYDVFISYSYNDRRFAMIVYQLLEQCGYSAYIDLRDPTLNRKYVSERTAKRLVDQMQKCKGLLYLYSPSSSVSKWCPWEVGVFSGIKDFRCANLPIVDNENDNFKNQEYLDLYPYVDYELNARKDKFDFWICESEEKYVRLRNWLEGEKPYIHKN